MRLFADPKPPLIDESTSGQPAIAAVLISCSTAAGFGVVTFAASVACTAVAVRHCSRRVAAFQASTANTTPGGSAAGAFRQ